MMAPDDDNDPRPLVSVVVPVLNEEEAVPLFLDRLTPVLTTLDERYRFEVLFCNNRSTDGTLDVIRAARARDPRVQVITYSRNVGYQASVFGGLRQARGDHIFIIDVDCEDPPELLPLFLDELVTGPDVVYGERDRRVEPRVITLARKIFYRVNRLVADSDIVLDMAEFCLMRAHVRDAVVSRVSTYPFLRAEIAHYGFERRAIRYDRQARTRGETHYNLWGMARFAVGGILSSTTAPLRATLYALPIVWLCTLAALAVDASPRVWQLVFAFDGLYVCTALAFLALYLARTYRNVIDRPIAVVDWRKSFVDAPAQTSPNALPALWRLTKNR
jgi:dolichol-phosphate mannosyltransferase